jgi:DNA ligase (NAD+)
MSRIQKLEAEIIKHKALYYQGRPEITDSAYDKIEEELRKLDPKNPTLQIVGSTTSASDKIKHDKKMLSLEKTYVLDGFVDGKRRNSFYNEARRNQLFTDLSGRRTFVC